MGFWKEIFHTSSKPKRSSSRSSYQPQQHQEREKSLDADGSSQMSSQGSLPSQMTRQPGTVNVDFKTNGSSLPKPAPKQAADPSPPPIAQQASQEGFLGPTGVYVPSTGFRTPSLLQRMKEKYDIPEEEIKKAMDFAESEEYVDVYCFTYCITGGPMEPTAYKIAGLQGMEKDAILECAGAPGTEWLRPLNSEEQQRHDKARKDFLVERALQDKEVDAPQPEDLEELSEAYRQRFEEDTADMSLEEVMVYFGVPEPSRVAIHRALHPAKGAATATLDEKARRKAAHAVALERFDDMS